MRFNPLRWIAQRRHPEAALAEAQDQVLDLGRKLEVAEAMIRTLEGYAEETVDILRESSERTFELEAQRLAAIALLDDATRRASGAELEVERLRGVVERVGKERDEWRATSNGWAAKVNRMIAVGKGE